jgi:hypothetical protein
MNASFDADPMAREPRATVKLLQDQEEEGWTKLTHALELAEKGFRVFPLNRDCLKRHPKEIKRPAIKNWDKAATTDEEQICDWWPDGNRNIGLAAGHGIVVLDYDMKEGQEGAKALAEHERLGLPVDGMRVTTPTGGVHLFFRTDRAIRNSASKIAKNVDVRGDGGYVVAPGSTIRGKPYVLREGPIPELPDWMAQLATAPKTQSSVNPRESLVELDKPSNIEAAAAWLKDEAPEAIEGSGGDETTYRVACRLRDFGLSKSECFNQLAQWNEVKAIPPWPFDELEQKVRNAYAYATLPAGNADPTLGFTNVEAELSEIEAQFAPQPKLFLATPFDVNIDFTKIPPRDWIVDKFLCRRYVTGLVSPGGAGKTQLACQMCVGLPTARQDVIGQTMKAKANVWFWCQEDDKNELNRRIGAAVQHFGVDQRELGGKLWVDSGVEKPLKVAVRNIQKGSIEESEYIQPIIECIKANKIDALIVDPLVELHEAKENDNGEMHEVVAILRKVAQMANCAVFVLAHTRKPPQGSSDGLAGNPDSIRGGGSQTNTFRVQYTLANMSEKDANRWGVPKNERSDYVRLDSSKANLFKSESTPYWYKKVSVALGGPDGERIGVLEPVTLSEGQSTDVLEIIAKTIAAGGNGLLRGEQYSLSKLFAVMTVSERGSFGSKGNQSRTINEALDSPGWIAQPGGFHTGVTVYGRLNVQRKKGRGGIRFSLEPEANVAPNNHGEVA